MARTVEAILKANTGGLDGPVTASAAKFDALGKKAVAAGGQIDSSITKASAATERLAAAQRHAADAAGTLRLANARLAAVQAQGVKGGTRLLAAQEAQAKAARAAAAAQGELGRAFKNLHAEQAVTGFGRLGKSLRENEQHIRTLGGGLTRFGLVTAVALGLVVKKAADFDQAMSRVGATGQDAQQSIDKLRQSALELGASTQFSATEVANAEEEMAKAGVTAADQLGGGLKGSLDLAAAGGLSVARSAEIAGTALKQFGLEGRQIPHVADLLAAGANAAVGSVEDLAQGLKFVGPVAKGMGISIEETVGTLTAFAAAGIVGEQGGTALRGVLLSLTSPSRAAAKEMARLGINMYDAQGAFIGIDGAAGQLQKALGTLSEAERNEALGRIFGNAQVTAANVLYQGGAGLIQNYTAQVNQSGAAAEQAALRMDNLKGDIEKLGGALETAFISTGGGANDFLRNLTQGATLAVDAFNSLSPAMQGNILQVAAIAGATALAVGGLSKLAVGIRTTRDAFVALGITARTAGIAMGAVGAAIAIAGVLVGNFAGKQAEAKARTDDLTEALVRSKGAIDANLAASRAKTLEDSGALKAAQDLGISIEDITQASLGNEAAQARVNAQLATFREVSGGLSTDLDRVQFGQNGVAESARKVEDAIGSGNKELDESTAAYRRRAAAESAAAGTTGTVTSAFIKSEIAFKNTAGAALDYGTALDKALAAADAINPAIKRTAEQSQKLATSLFAQGDAFQNSVAASSAYQASIDEVNKTLDANGKFTNKAKTELKDNSEEARANIGVLNSLASSGKQYVQSLIQQGEGADKAKAATQQVRDEFIKAARAAGLGETAAKSLADSYGLIPSKVSTKVEAFGLAVQKARVDEFTASLNALPASKRARILSIFDKKGTVAAQNALAALKDKEVIARSKSDLKGAKQVKSAMAALKDRLVEAKSRGDTKGAEKLKAAMAALKDKEVKASVKAEGIGKVQSSINAITGTSVTVRVRTAAIAYGGKVPGLAYGGTFDEGRKVRSGTYTPRADDVEAMLSRNEWVIQEPSARRYGDSAMAAVNAGKATIIVGSSVFQGFAAGGTPAGYAAGGQVINNTDLATILRMIRALSNPLSSIVGLRAQLDKANRVTVAPRAVLTRATRRDTAARERRADIAERVANLRKEAAATKGSTKADRDYRKAKKDLAASNKEVTKTSDAKTKASEKYNKVADIAKAKAAALAAVQQQVADTARQVSSTLAGAADTTSTDPLDVLAKRRETTAMLVTFNSQLAALKKSGLNAADIEGIVARGTLDGSELAQAILNGGKSLVTALNSAQASLVKAADAVGYTSGTGVIRRAGGGEVYGPGTSRQDRVRLLASPGEFVVNAASAAANAGLVRAINNSDGRSIAYDLVRGLTASRAVMNTSSAVSNNRHIEIPVHIGQVGLNEQQVAYRVQGKIMDALVMSGMAGVT